MWVIRGVRLLLGGLALGTAAAYADGGVPLWTNSYSGPAGGTDSAAAITVDRNGNVSVTGSSWNGSDNDYATVAYSNAGVPLWTNWYGGAPGGDDQARAIATDADGNVFVTGLSWNGADYDYATVAYSGAGVGLWTNRYDSMAGNENAKAVAVDASGNAIVTGGGAVYATTIKYTGAGAPLWTNRYTGPGGGAGTSAIALDANDNVFVTGASKTSSGFGDGVTLAYSSAGLPLWTNRYNSCSSLCDAGSAAIVVDGGGNVLVTGYEGIGYVTIKYSGTGVALWTNRYTRPGGVASPSAMAVDSNDNVFVTGYSHDAGIQEYTTVAYSSSGLPLWTSRYSEPGDAGDRAWGIAVDSGGNVFVSGTCAPNYDLATVAYSRGGSPLWTNRVFGSASVDYLSAALAVDPSGSVLITGTSDAGGTEDYLTVQYSSSVQPYLNHQKLGNQLILTWTNAGFNLESTANLVAPVWVTNSVPPSVVNGQYIVTNPVVGAQQFYRLSL
jgi:hypothetical protein